MHRSLKSFFLLMCLDCFLFCFTSYVQVVFFMSSNTKLIILKLLSILKLVYVRAVQLNFSFKSKAVINVTTTEL